MFFKFKRTFSSCLFCLCSFGESHQLTSLGSKHENEITVIDLSSYFAFPKAKSAILTAYFVWSHTKWTASRRRVSVISEQLWSQRQDDINLTPWCPHDESVAVESQHFLRKTKVITATPLRMGNFDVLRLNDEDGTRVRLGTRDSFV